MSHSYLKLHNGTPLEFEIAQTGRYRGKTANLGWQFAFRSSGWSSTSLYGDCAEYLDTSQQAVNTPTPGVQYYIRSSSVNDTAAGIGIRSMRINYLKTDGTRTIVNVDLSGTTAVPVASDIKFIQYMESNTVGATGVAAGNITISSVTGAPTVSQIVEYISAGKGRSLSGRVMVPKDFSLYMLGWSVTAKGTTMDAMLRATVFTDDRSVSGGFHFQDNAYLADGAVYEEDLHYLAHPPGAIIKLSAIPTSAPAGNKCSGSFHFLLVNDR